MRFRVRVQDSPRPFTARWLAAGLLAGVLVVVVAVSGCGNGQDTQSGPQDVTLASATSARDSGLLDALLPAFEQAYPAWRVKVESAGSGEVLEMGRDCDADVLLVDSPEAEEGFIDDRYGQERKDVMYNDFVIVGPVADPAGIAGGSDAAAAMKKIAANGSEFVSRGDDSGTNVAELMLWELAGYVRPSGIWYLSTGRGQGETLRVADELGAYTVTDRGTWLAMEDRLGSLGLLVEGDSRLLNQYGVIAIDSGRCPQANARGAQDLVSWLTSPEGRQAIGQYGVERYGEPLFNPGAK